MAGTWVTSAHISRVPWPRPPARAPDVAGQSGGVCAFSAVLLGCVRVGSQLPERGPILNIVLVHLKFRRGCLSRVRRCGAALPVRAGLQSRAPCLKPWGARRARGRGFPRGSLKHRETLTVRHQSATLFLGPGRKGNLQEGNVNQGARPSGVCAKDTPGAFQKGIQPKNRNRPPSPRAPASLPRLPREGHWDSAGRDSKHPPCSWAILTRAER